MPVAAGKPALVQKTLRVEVLAFRDNGGHRLSLFLGRASVVEILLISSAGAPTEPRFGAASAQLPSTHI
jgi:hypothetical protein